MSRVRSTAFAVFVISALTTASVAGASPASAAKAKKPATITVLVTNDDGVAAPGIDSLVQALSKAKNTKVVVVAPAENQSGTGGKTTPGTLTTTAATTASGYEATAVAGFPADTVTAALDQLGVKPNVVMSGINAGQNLGALHRPVGHGRCRRGWLRPAASRRWRSARASATHRSTTTRRSWRSTGSRSTASQLAKKPKAAPTTITNYNAPNCPAGKPRGIKKVTTATTTDGAIADVDCAAAVTAPTTDIEAFNAGWVSQSDLSTTPATPAS